MIIDNYSIICLTILTLLLGDLKMSELKEWDKQIAITLPVSDGKSYSWIHNTSVSSRRRIGANDCEIAHTKDAVVPVTELNKVLSRVSELYDTINGLRQKKFEACIILTPVTKKAVNLIIEECFPEEDETLLREFIYVAGTKEIKTIMPVNEFISRANMTLLRVFKPEEKLGHIVMDIDNVRNAQVEVSNAHIEMVKTFVSYIDLMDAMNKQEEKEVLQDISISYSKEQDEENATVIYTTEGDVSSTDVHNLGQDLKKLGKAITEETLINSAIDISLYKSQDASATLKIEEHYPDDPSEHTLMLVYYFGSKQIHVDALYYGGYPYNQSKLEIFKPPFTKGYFVIDANNIDLTQYDEKNPHHLAIKTLMNYVNVVQPKP